jgi:hypothetical protein
MRSPHDRAVTPGQLSSPGRASDRDRRKTWQSRNEAAFALRVLVVGPRSLFRDARELQRISDLDRWAARRVLADLQQQLALMDREQKASLDGAGTLVDGVLDDAELQEAATHLLAHLSGAWDGGDAPRSIIELSDRYRTLLTPTFEHPVPLPTPDEQLKEAARAYQAAWVRWAQVNG